MQVVRANNLILRQDRALECHCGHYSCEDSIVPALPYRRVRSTVIDHVWQCFVPLATLSAGTQGRGWSPLVGIEGDQVKANLMYKVPVGEPGVFPVRDEVGAGRGHCHTVQHLTLGGGGEHFRCFHDLEVIMEGFYDPSPVGGGKQFISERDGGSSVSERPGHL
ncbi:UNVERIFIED_CONTAM: hypothetical protein NCL1_51840 [Trichonephila clavipes]